MIPFIIKAQPTICRVIFVGIFDLHVQTITPIIKHEVIAIFSSSEKVPVLTEGNKAYVKNHYLHTSL